MRMTSKGQVTIPQHIREAAGFLPGTEIEFVMDDTGNVRVRRHADQPENLALKAALGLLRGRATTKMTTDEIMALTRE
ncbi:AbrB/MazE/SpoVT family DNA-binding domain-containing protein [uncultured Jannaschia sp.]|uniref:AbrB/MazE/SpoVT family DNA-binding domain-containing protein n=1 Tax=uncultured Jannaschia sp. TaxID=293347 RepID=UPI002626513F|nr:AbrB/MazE/SpoVT family DNA-binding domain-containing protein [uncultured Jannaschia sp.]